MISWKPRTEKQSDMVSEYMHGQNICAHGSAGTGKSFVSLALAMSDVLDDNQPQDHVIIVRSCVPTRDMGYLPGTQEEKAEPYELPYEEALAELFHRDSTYSKMKERGLIEFRPTAFLRGLTWENAIVIVDEIQNMTFHELYTVVTRAGQGTRIILCGDTKQDDLSSKEHSGLNQWLSILSTIRSFSIIKFTSDDIVRCDLVKEIIIAVESACNKEYEYGEFSEWDTDCLQRRLDILATISSLDGEYCIPLCYEMQDEMISIWDELMLRHDDKDNTDNVLQLVKTETKTEKSED
jgi:phosphate starvation-inducible PhoH-like protein